MENQFGILGYDVCGSLLKLQPKIDKPCLFVIEGYHRNASFKYTEGHCNLVIVGKCFHSNISFIFLY